MNKITIKNDVNNPVTLIALIILVAIGAFLATRRMCGLD
jgi:hypothetical protein